MGSNNLPREWALIDKRRRITIPKRFINALGITPEMLNKKHPILIEAYPSLEDCRTVILKKR